MSFIESWLGFSPDGGNGAVESLYIGVFVIAAMLIVDRIRRKHLDIWPGKQ